MTAHPTITLLTDFGLEDEYVASMKGVIVSLLPEARIIDISHAVPPGDIERGSFLLDRARGYFPQNTVHLSVIDPGVGTSRKIIAVKTPTAIFIAPDNGLLTPVLKSETGATVYEVSNRIFFLGKQSNTFHGRDIMAPVAARLAAGLDIQKVGRRLSLDACERHVPERCFWEEGILVGKVVRIDHFGNLCTNIPLSTITGSELGNDPIIIIGHTRIKGLRKTYGEVQDGTILALADSHQYLEIGVAKGSAAKQTGATVGDKIIVCHQ